MKLVVWFLSKRFSMVPISSTLIPWWSSLDLALVISILILPRTSSPSYEKRVRNLSYEENWSFVRLAAAVFEVAHFPAFDFVESYVDVAGWS
jgi:hypothetical protein